MKKVFTLITALSLTLGTFAQQIPNGSFEQWTSPLNPDQWSTVANAYGGVGSTLAVKDTTAGNHVSGSASLKLFSDSVQAAGGVVVSEVGLGSNSPANNLTFFGYPYTKRPDSLFVFIKYNPATGDTALLQFDLTKAGVSLFGGVGGVKIASTPQWSEYYIPLSTYYSTTVTGAPDTLLLIFSSGNPQVQPAIYGSTLWVDSVHFDASVNTTGIEQLTGDITGINAYPNPATNQINLAIQADEIGSQIQLIDMEGRIVYSGILNEAKSSIDTRPLQSGVYAIHVNSIDKLTIYKGKITIAK